MPNRRPPRGRRPGGGERTREAIVEAARELFAEHGFAETTIRAVATRAGVDPALVHYYFADKDGLLVESVDLPVDPSVVLGGLADEPGPVGEALVLRLLTTFETVPGALERMQALIRTGVSHEAATTALREYLGRTVLLQLSDLVAPDQAELRATLVGSQVAGLLLGRYLLKLPPLADAPREVVAVAVGRSITHYLSGPLD